MSPPPSEAHSNAHVLHALFPPWLHHTYRGCCVGSWRQRWRRDALHVCANVTKWKVMQISELITSRPLLHPVASNVSHAERFPSCFSCRSVHVSTAPESLLPASLSSHLHGWSAWMVEGSVLPSALQTSAWLVFHWSIYLSPVLYWSQCLIFSSKCPSKSHTVWITSTLASWNRTCKPFFPWLTLVLIESALRIKKAALPTPYCKQTKNPVYALISGEMQEVVSEDVATHLEHWADGLFYNTCITH